MTTTIVWSAALIVGSPTAPTHQLAGLPTTQALLELSNRHYSWRSKHWQKRKRLTPAPAVHVAVVLPWVNGRRLTRRSHRWRLRALNDHCRLLSCLHWGLHRLVDCRLVRRFYRSLPSPVPHVKHERQGDDSQRRDYVVLEALELVNETENCCGHSVTYLFPKSCWPSCQSSLQRMYSVSPCSAFALPVPWR